MKNTVNKTHIAKLKQQRKVVGMLQFEHKDEANFSKWYALTENLVIKAFDQKSNQLVQLHKIYHDMKSLRDLSWENLETSEAKEKLKNLLSVYIDELELDVEEEQKPIRRTGSSIRMTNIQTVTQNVDISTVIKTVIQNVQQTEPDPEKVKEAEEKLLQLEKEMTSKSPTWATVKGILEWLLNFSRDAFLAVLPILLEKYK